MLTRIAAIAMLTIGYLATGWCGDAVVRASEYALKAAFIYQFTKFVEWPAEKISGSKSFNICFFGEPGVDPNVVDFLNAKMVNGLPVTTLPVDAAKNLATCHILFIAKSKNSFLNESLAAIENAHVLTVGETDRFAHDGGMISLLMINNRITFEINLQAAEAGGINLSSKLLQLGTLIDRK